MSNGQSTRAGGHPPQWRHVSELDPQAPAQPHTHQSQWPAQQQDYQPYAYPNGHAAAPQHGSHGQHSSHAPQNNPYASQHDNPYASQHGGYAPQPPAYPAYPEDTQNHGAGHAHQGYGQPATQHPPFFAAQPAAPAANPFTTSFEQFVNGHAHAADGYRGQEQHRAPEPTPASLRDQLRGAHYQDQWQPQPSPRDYDLGSYMPAGGNHQPAPDYGHGLPGGRGDYAGDARWGDQDSYDHHGYDEHGLTLPVAADQHEHDDSDYDYEEPPKKRRGLLVVASLVSAIVVGGGLAYAYKMILGSPQRGSTPPVIRADARPTKIQPVEPGGKQFANADSKLMGRLESDNASQSSNQDAGQGSTSGSSADSDGGVRKVSTVTIGRDGMIAAPSAEPRLPPPTVVVPGMNVDYGPRGGPAFQARRAPEGPRSVPVPPSGSAGAPLPQPQVISRTPPAPQPEVVAEAQPAPQPPVSSKRQLLPPPRTTAPEKQRTAALEAPSAVAAPKPTSSGFVAVLSSQKSRMDALKAFADLQQKYPSVLQNKIPDVQEADLSARGYGIMYRAVVGPPGSREAANDVCAQLKSAGYASCWITAY